MKAYSNFLEIQHDLKNGTLSCQERVHFHLSGIKRLNHLNAFLSVYEIEALNRAKLVDQKIKKGTAGKLAGLIVGLKDVFAYKDHPQQSASKILEGYISPYNATVVQRLLDEDAIIIGRQNCDEFAMGSSTEKSAYGPTLHPKDQQRVPGGSSGGSAVAVAANMCQVSLGSDTGGSVRQPSAFCGIMGLKPTYSRISRYGMIAYASSFDCVGIFARHVEDIALVLEVLAGQDAFDSTVSRTPVPQYFESLRTDQSKKYTITYLEHSLSLPTLQPAVKESFENYLEELREKGYKVESTSFPLFEYMLPTYYILATAEASSNLARYDGVRYGPGISTDENIETLYKRARSKGFGNEVKRRILMGTFVLRASQQDAYYRKAQKVRRLIRNATRQLFNNFDFVITPTTPTTAFRLGEHSENLIDMYLADLFSVHANVAGVPAISIPIGEDREGMPMGVQVMSDDFEEAKLLKFSQDLVRLRLN